MIALTHMRQPERLEQGHCVRYVRYAIKLNAWRFRPRPRGPCHHYGVYEQGGAKIVKSGTDFRTLSALGTRVRASGCCCSPRDARQRAAAASAPCRRQAT